ncbi:hypothetical protein [Actinomadura sp. WAC 06369]|uniref:hypothetical protein n=1 Tax=Actinomadura sp. WAC 06369 TaxID=2203193 RepID=UPI000F7951BC|nr:hypothetical protein [Actinomadura sp. WAC 06369]RSN70992.1 hypothetical protein DMH08_04135 [Actinomadura sp. WAC 06369]
MDLPLPRTAYDIEFDDEGRDGHAFGRPPGLRPEQWPRSRVNGLPMAHLFTVRVPEEYRCAGGDLAGLSVFQSDDHVADAVEGRRTRSAGPPRRSTARRPRRSGPHSRPTRRTAMPVSATARTRSAAAGPGSG